MILTRLVVQSANPTLAGGYDTSGYAQGVALSGGYAYVADYDEGLVVVDVSDPTNPARAGSYDTSGYAWDVAVAETTAVEASPHRRWPPLSPPWPSSRCAGGAENRISTIHSAGQGDSHYDGSLLNVNVYPSGLGPLGSLPFNGMLHSPSSRQSRW